MTIDALFLILSANFFGGSSYFATAYALKGFSAVSIVFWRVFLGTFFFLPFSIKALRNSRLNMGDWLRLVAVGTVGFALPLITGTMGQNLSNATHASLLISVEPAAIIFLSALFLGESLTALKIIALALSALGSLLIVLQGLPSFHVSIQSSFQGDLLLCLQSVAFALYSVMGKPLLKKMDAVSFTALTTSIALVPMAFAARSVDSLLPVAGVSWLSLLAVAYLGVAVTFLGTMLWNKALEKVPASQMANFIFLQPLIGVILGVSILRDTLTLWSVCGGGLILLGVYCAAKEPEGSIAPA